jgi:hypothetical protein
MLREYETRFKEGQRLIDHWRRNGPVRVECGGTVRVPAWRLPDPADDVRAALLKGPGQWRTMASSLQE